MARQIHILKVCKKMTKEFKMDMFCCDGSQARDIVYLSRFDSWREVCMDTDHSLTHELETMLAKMFATTQY